MAETVSLLLAAFSAGPQNEPSTTTRCRQCFFYSLSSPPPQVPTAAPPRGRRTQVPTAALPRGWICCKGAVGFPQAAPDGAVWGLICVGFGRLPPPPLLFEVRRFSNLQTLSSRALTLCPVPVAWQSASSPSPLELQVFFRASFYIHHHLLVADRSRRRACVCSCVLVCARVLVCACCSLASRFLLPTSYFLFTFSAVGSLRPSFGPNQTWQL